MRGEKCLNGCRVETPVPNLTDQSNLTPQQAAQLWPQYETVAAHRGVKIVGPPS
jgi:hypothetical protein